MSDKVLYFVPVEGKYLERWEYYKVDYDALCGIFDSVVVCTSIYQVLKNIRGTKLIYCWWWHQSAPVVLFARMLGVRVFVTGAIHMFDLSGAADYYAKGILYRLASRISLALANRNLFISRDQYLQVVSHLKVKAPVVLRSSLLSEASVPAQTIIQKRAEARSNVPSKRRIQLLTIVWHTLDQYTRKGVFETLEALALLRDRTDIDFQWIVAGGDAPGSVELGKRIVEMGLGDHVSVRLDISVSEKEALFLNSDIYIQPSWCEGFGNAVLEAMSHGLPALVSRYTAQPEVVGGDGFITLEITGDAICEQLLLFFCLSEADRQALVSRVLSRVENEFSFGRRHAELAALVAEG